MSDRLGLLPCCYHLLGGGGLSGRPSAPHPRTPLLSTLPLSNVCHCCSPSVICRSLTGVRVGAGEWRSMAPRVGGIKQRVTGLQVKCCCVAAAVGVKTTAQITGGVERISPRLDLWGRAQMLDVFFPPQCSFCHYYFMQQYCSREDEN